MYQTTFELKYFMILVQMTDRVFSLGGCKSWTSCGNAMHSAGMQTVFRQCGFADAPVRDSNKSINPIMYTAVIQRAITPSPQGLH